MTNEPQLGEALGRLAFAPLLLLGAWFLGRHLGRKKNPPRFVAWPIVAAAILLVLGAVGNMNRHKAGGTTSEQVR